MNPKLVFIRTTSIFLLLAFALGEAGGIPARAAQSGPESTPPAGLSAEDWSQIQDLLRGALPAQQAYVKASNTEAGDSFGSSIAVSGDTVVVGAPYEDSGAGGVNGNQADNSAAHAGAVYVFVRSGTTWTQQAYLKASNAESGDSFGISVAISGDTVVVGAYGEDSNADGVNGNQADNSAADSGAAYVFARSGMTWSQQAYLKASNSEAYDYFGWSVATSGETVVVGAWGEDSNATGVNGDQAYNFAYEAGAAYVFLRSGTTWSQQAYLKASNTRGGEFFGTAVAISGDTVVIGAHSEDSNATGVNGNQSDTSAPQSGAAYVFIRSGTTWSQQAYLKASNTETDDYFGYSVAIDADAIVIGAYQEDSTATGVNGNQADNSAVDSGAAYVFVRTGTIWSQQAYLKASNTEAYDMFSFPVAISGDTVVVGAYKEDSNAGGVNGNQADNSAVDSGAGYVFTRSGTTWSQQAYVKASNTEMYDGFGDSVAISGDMLAVGAYGEDSSATGVNGNQANNSASGSGAAYVFVSPNNNPTDISLSNSSVAENQPVGTVVGALSTTDPDAGDTHSYSFACSTPGVDDTSFQISGSNLQTNAVFNYETKNSYSICIRTNDGNGGTFDKNFTISVTNANDAPTNISLSNSSVAENQAVGTVVGALSTTDPDAGNTHTYSFGCTVPGANDASFSITGNALKTAQVFNYEMKNSYAICVRTNDGNGGTYDKNFTITVTNANDAPTDITLSNNSVAENLPVGTVVGGLSTTDPDAGDTHTYSLGCTVPGANDASFSITGNALKTAQVFNYEMKNSYAICVRTNDGNGGTYDKNFTITVTDANDAPTNITLSNNSVAENQPVGTVVGTLTTADPDPGDMHTYSFTCSIQGADDASFQIGGEGIGGEVGNELQTAAVFNYAMKNSYNICVRTIDEDDATFDKNFTINITDANNAPTDIVLSNTSVNENQPIGTTVGALSTTDPDAGDTHTYDFTCTTPGVDDASFAIVGIALNTAGVFDYETKSSYNICVRTDDGNGGTYDENFAITVTDVLETITATIRSTGTQDGWILESGENTNTGGTLDSTSTVFNLGDGAGDKQYRAFLSFTTGALPDYAVITKVTLKIKRQGVTGTNPFTILGGLIVDVRKPFFGATLGLAVSDFQAMAGKSAAATFATTPVAYWYSAVIGSGSYSHINKTGTTQFRLRFATDDNNDNAEDYMKFYSGNTAFAASRPALVIEYYVP